MEGEDDVADNLTEGADEGDAAEAETEVNLIVKRCSEKVADRGRQEEEGGERVCKVIIRRYLFSPRSKAAGRGKGGRQN
jgi:hypothetical protein